MNGDMIPIPKVAKVVEPRCSQCGEPDAEWAAYWSRSKRLLIVDDGPPICRLCLRMDVRLAQAKRDAA